MPDLKGRISLYYQRRNPLGSPKCLVMGHTFLPALLDMAESADEECFLPRPHLRLQFPAPIHAPGPNPRRLCCQVLPYSYFHSRIIEFEQATTFLPASTWSFPQILILNSSNSSAFAESGSIISKRNAMAPRRATTFRKSLKLLSEGHGSGLAIAHWLASLPQQGSWRL